MVCYRPKFWECWVALISTALRLRRGAGSQGCAPSGWANLRVIPSINSVGGDGTRHDDNGSHLSLIQLDLGAKRLESRDGADQSLGVKLVDRTGFGHDISVPKIRGEICKAIEDALEEAVAIPMNKGHKADTFGPLIPIGIVDETNEVHQNLTEDWLRLIAGADGRDHRIHVNTETREVSNIDHGSDTSDGRLASGFLRIDDVHHVLIGSSIFGGRFAIDETLVLLG